MAPGIRDTLAREWLRSLSPLDDGEALVGAAARELARAEPIEAAHAIGALIDAASDEPKISRALGALISALASARSEDLPGEVREAIAAAAVAFDIPAVAALFTSATPTRTLVKGETPQADPSMAGVTLGHKRQLARSIDPGRAARWAAESDPSVIHNLLLNPRLTEDLVVRVAARRPARAETLREIWASRRWSVRRRVRLALAQNPYIEPEIAVRILPLLSVPDLKAIADNSTLHGAVRDAAKAFMRTRRKAHTPSK